MNSASADDYSENDTKHEEISSWYQTENMKHPKLAKPKASIPLKECNELSFGYPNPPDEIVPCGEDAVKCEPDEIEIFEPKFEEIDVEMNTTNPDDYPENDTKHKETSAYQTENMEHAKLVKLNTSIPLEECDKFSFGELNPPGEIVPCGEESVKCEPDEIEIFEPKFEEIDVDMNTTNQDYYSENDTQHKEISSRYQTESIKQTKLVKLNTSIPSEECDELSFRELNPPDKIVPCWEEAVKCEPDEIEIFEPKFEEIYVEMKSASADDYPENDTKHEEISSWSQIESMNHTQSAKPKASIISEECNEFSFGELNPPDKILSCGDEAVKCESDEIEIFEPKFEEIDAEMGSRTADDNFENETEQEEITAGHQLENVNNKIKGDPTFEGVEPVRSWHQPFPAESGNDSHHPLDNISCPQPSEAPTHLEVREQAPTKPRPFKCKTCKVAFTKKRELVTHMRRHTGERPFLCDVCAASFVDSSSLFKHKRGRHSEERPYKCDVCQAAFTRLSHLTRHKGATHMGERPFKCDECPSAFSRLSHLTKHKCVKHAGEKPFKCDTCEASYYDSSQLTKHKRATHAGERPFMCDVCQATFILLHHLTRHKRTTHTGERPFECDVCQAAFSQLSNLTRHKRATHMGERPFKCDECQAAFSESSTLTNHKRQVHKGERPFKCDVCQAAFSQSSNLTTHKRATHMGERPFKCDECSAAFSRLSHLTKHNRAKHVGEKPYKCDACQASYYDSSQLAKHKCLRHTGVRPFMCDVCQASFTQSRHLTSHKRETHMGVRPFKCDVCQAAFPRLPNLVKHKRVKHADDKP